MNEFDEVKKRRHASSLETIGKNRYEKAEHKPTATHDDTVHSESPRFKKLRVKSKIMTSPKPQPSREEVLAITEQSTPQKSEPAVLQTAMKKKVSEMSAIEYYWYKKQLLDPKENAGLKKMTNLMSNKAKSSHPQFHSQEKLPISINTDRNSRLQGILTQMASPKTSTLEVIEQKPLPSQHQSPKNSKKRASALITTKNGQIPRRKRSKQSMNRSRDSEHSQERIGHLRKDEGKPIPYQPFLATGKFVIPMDGPMNVATHMRGSKKRNSKLPPIATMGLPKKSKKVNFSLIFPILKIQNGNR